MAKCEVIDLTLSDSDSDGDFIQSKKAIHPFLYPASVYYIKYNGNYFVHVRSKYCSLPKSARLIWKRGVRHGASRRTRFRNPLDFTWISDFRLDFCISRGFLDVWISGFQLDFLDFRLDFCQQCTRFLS